MCHANVAYVPDLDDDVNFEYCSANGTTFANANVEGISFDFADLRGANFSNCMVRAVDFENDIVDEHTTLPTFIKGKSPKNLIMVQNGVIANASLINLDLSALTIQEISFESCVYVAGGTVWPTNNGVSLTDEEILAYSGIVQLGYKSILTGLVNYENFDFSGVDFAKLGAVAITEDVQAKKAVKAMMKNTTLQ